MALANSATLARESTMAGLATRLRTIFLGTATILTLATGMILLVIITILTLGLAQNWVVEFFSRTMGRMILWFARVELRIEYLGEKVKSPAVYISNHSSTLDLFGIMALGLPRTRYVAKYELMYNPFFGVMGLLTGQIFIKRQDSVKAIAVINRAYERIRRKNLSLFVAPEGTRIEGGQIGQFKKGAFRMAMDLQYPIVPIHFAGARRLCPGKTFVVTPGTVYARFYPQIDTSSWTFENLEEQVNNIRQEYIRREREFENQTKSTGLGYSPSDGRGENV
ncbi:MAG: lysophospholipid acyltransferase family protein [bacterium]